MAVMNCWFYAAKAVVYAKTRRLLLEADYLSGAGTGWEEITGRDVGPESWLRWGLPGDSFPDFASRFDFAQPSSRPSTWTAEDLEATLRACGPLWFGGANGSAHHVVVIHGIDRGAIDGDRRGELDRVHYGDPATGGNHLAALDVFNGWKQQTLRLWNPMFYAGR